MVAARRERVHGLQNGTAAEWREWERLDPPKDEFRVIVETADGRMAASADIGPGHFPRPDGTQSGGVGTFRAHQGKGLGTALLAVIEAEAKRRDAPRILAGTSVAIAGSLEWAQKRGYTEIGRRIESYVYVQTFDPSPFADVVGRVNASGLELRTLGEVLAGRDEEARERFWRALYDADAPMWEDVAWATPTPHLPRDKFHQMMAESGKLLPEATNVAVDRDAVAGYTSTGKSGTQPGHTVIARHRR